MHTPALPRASLAMLSLLVVACGASAPPSSSDPRLVEVHVAPFHATLPSGDVVALDEAGQITVDGESRGTLQPDGRLEGTDGSTLAALLPDGRISFGGELTDATIEGAHVSEGGRSLLELDQDRSLTIRSGTGAELATVPVVGVTPSSRSAVLFVLAFHMLTASRDAIRAQALALEGGPGVARVRVPIEGRPVRGPSAAPITMVIFSDFQCPFCGRVIPTLEELQRTYGDRIRFVFAHQPLPFHDHAEDAATLAIEAAAQRGDAGFWAAHDLLFANQQHLERADLLRHASQLGLDVERVRRALDGDLHRRRLEIDAADASRLGVRGTPTFFVNGIRVVGAQPIEVFRQTIDAELANAERLAHAGVPSSRLYSVLMEHALDAPPPEAERAAPPRRRTPDPSALYRVPADGAPTRGPADALVTIVMFSDFQCPFCARVVPTLEQLRERYGTDVRIVFRENPLPFHDHAMPAAEAALEAYAQGGDDAFWRMHDLLFEHRDELERSDLEGYARELHLDLPRFRRALDQHTHAAAIAADQALAQQLGATGTPAFFINGRSLRGAQPFESFATLIDAELARARAQVAAGTPRASVYAELTRAGATAPVYLPDAPDEEDDEPEDDRVYALPLPSSAPSRGAASAPVTIQIFSDFQCPFCARVRPTLDTVMSEYAGRVRLVWRNYPLPFHQHAQLAAEAAMEVFAQRGDAAFWEYEALLFEHQRDLEQEDLESYARRVAGIDLRRFRAALADHRHAAAVRADMDAVRAAGAEIGTPSFFIDGRLLQGAQPIEAFRTAIDRALAEHH